MQSTPVISVIMPVYNGEAYVGAAIQSVLDQTYPHFELLIINDGSVDGTSQIVKTFIDPRIVYLDNPSNLGLIASLNRGIACARGIYIARMDHDDLSLPERFAKQLAAFERDPGLAVVGTSYFLFNGNARRRAANHWSTHSDYLKAVLLFSACFAHPTVMLRRSALNGHLYDAQFKHVEDYRLWTELARQGSFLVLPEPLLLYRLHATQTTAVHRQTQFQLSATIRQHYLEALGFVVSSAQLLTHNRIGNNDFLRSLAELEQARDWLENLLAQNQANGVLNAEAFALALHKFWIDLCGHTNLGIKAYKCYKSSVLARESKAPSGALSRLLLKCLLRTFR